VRSVFSKSGGREKKVKEKRNGKSGAKRRYVDICGRGGVMESVMEKAYDYVG
jgi:hypothetical protein